MLPKSEKLCLDILTAIGEIRDFLAEASLESFTQSRLQQVAVERELEIIGDGARQARRWSMRSVGPRGVTQAGAQWATKEQVLKRLERTDESLFQQVENGHKIIGMRNVLAHGYDVIDYRILWSTVTRDIEPLACQIECLIND